MWCIIDTLILLGYGAFSHSLGEKILADTIGKQMVTKILYFGANQYVLLATTKISFVGPRNLKNFSVFFLFPFYPLKSIFKNLQALKVLLHFSSSVVLKQCEEDFWLASARKITH